MNLEPQITLRNITIDSDLENTIKEKTSKLQQLMNTIIFCDIVIESPQNHKNKGKAFAIHIKCGVPDKVLVVNHQCEDDLAIAIRDAFMGMEQQLRAYKTKQQSSVKNTNILLKGNIVRIFHEDEFGFIEGGDGEEYYFNSGNFADNINFHNIQSGTSVHFYEADGPEGPQAVRIKCIKKEAD